MGKSFELSVSLKAEAMKPIAKSRWPVALAGLILLATCGCSAVISKRPVGEQPARIPANQWEGDWLTHDGTVRVKVVDANKGILKAFWIDDDQKGNPAMRTATIELRESGGWLFANTEDEKGRGYVWGRITNKDGQILFWAPEDRRFSQLIQDGVIPGKIDAGTVFLGDLKPRHFQFITSGHDGLLFQWDQPTVFVKAGN